MQKYIILILLPILFVCGCQTARTPLVQAKCPPPPSQNCRPDKWLGTSMDTSEIYRRTASDWYEFSEVKTLNSPEDEWGVSFIDSKRAFLTFNDRDLQQMMIVKFNNESKTSVESGIASPFEGSIGAISIRNNYVAVAASNRPEDPDNFIGNSDIYTAELYGKIIKNARNLGTKVHKDKSTWESQPSISADGNVIFFSSDRNHLKGTDLFFTVKLPDGSWSDAYNCGDSINTDCEEITPFLSIDGKQLLFSSCGHETVGGFDIFSSNIAPEFWDAVKSNDRKALNKAGKYFSYAKNMRAPLNTTADELFPSSPGNPNELLYYSSNQAGAVTSIVQLKGGFDIYMRKKIIAPPSRKGKTTAEIPTLTDVTPDENNTKLPSEKNIPEIPKPPKPPVIPPTYTVTGTVRNANTQEPIPNADVYVRQTEGPPPTLKRDNYVDKDREIDLTSQNNDKQYDKFKLKSDTSGQSTIDKDREIDLAAQNSDKFFDSFKVKSDDKGNYSIVLEKDREYEISAQTDDMFFDSFKTRIEKDDPTLSIKRDMEVPPELTLRINFPTNVYSNPYKYSIDSSGIETNQTWEEALNLLANNLKHSKNISKLILIGHTDDVGNEDFNNKLGQNRVNFIIAGLIQRGVSKDILEGKSAGESELLQQLPDETTKMWRKRCRRVELQKINK